MAQSLLIDFETYSELNLKRVGAYRYAQHPSTDIICMSWSVDDAPERLWTPEDGPLPPPLLEAVRRKSCLIDAHYAAFERLIWRHVGVPRYGFPEVEDHRWRCSMAACGYRALPLNLKQAAGVLDLETQKDMEGQKSLRQVSQPDKQGERRRDFVALDRTHLYCLQDNAAERELVSRVGRLPADEQRIWQLDQRMQDRGLRIDLDLCHAAVRVAAKYEKRLNAELPDLTGGVVTAATQRDRILDWLQGRGLPIENLQADTVREMASDPLTAQDPEARRVLEVRGALAKASHKKYGRAIESACDDGRVRGATQYHAAHTGRWGGRLIQPQNMRRPVYCEDMHALAAAIKTKDVDFIECVGGADLMECLADAVRGMIVSEDGNVLVCGDYSAVEAVVTAGISNEERKLDVFRRGEDPYCWFASHVVGHPVTKEEHPRIRQDIGKPGELAFGYQGGVGAWRNFDDTNNFTDAEVEDFRDEWRSLHPRTVDAWSGLDHAARSAVNDPGQVFRYVAPGYDRSRGIAFVCRGDWLLCRLPSGRRLHYYRPSVRMTPMPWTDDDGNPIYRPQVWYWTQKEGRWQHVKGYGGHWMENIVQAISRDLMVPGMFAAEDAGFPLILTVHDELLSEIGCPGVSPRTVEEEFVALIVRKPPYAEDWPIGAGAWVDTRYKKE